MFFLGKIAFSNEICLDYVRKMCIKCVICLGELHIYCSKVSFYLGNRVSALFGMDKLHQMCDLSRGITHLLFKSDFFYQGNRVFSLSVIAQK